MKNTFDLVASALRFASHSQRFPWLTHEFGELEGVTPDRIKTVCILTVQAHLAGDDVRNFRAVCEFVHAMAFQCELQPAFCNLATEEIAKNRRMWLEAEDKFQSAQ